MNTNPSSPVSPSQPQKRAPLVWTDSKEFGGDTPSGVVVSVRVARPFPTSSRIFSVQVGSKRDGRVTQFIAMFFDRESTKLTSTAPRLQHNYWSELSSLIAQAMTYIEEQGKLDHDEKMQAAVDRDTASLNQGRPPMRQTGKTERERVKRSGK